MSHEIKFYDPILYAGIDVNQCTNNYIEEFDSLISSMAKNYDVRKHQVNEVVQNL